MSGPGVPVPPVLRIAPLGELRVYQVFEHELESLAQGSPASIFFNFAVALLPLSLSFFATLLVPTIESIYVFALFVCLCAVCFIAGLVCLILWWRTHKSIRTLLIQIKNRMPPPPGEQLPPPPTPPEGTT